MTAFDQFDPFEQRISAALDEIAAPARPDYLADVFGVTARTTQRPRWSFLERWLPMDIAIGPVAARRVPLRPLLILALVLLLVAAAAALYVGAQRRIPPPFGPADNGQIAYTANGDLYVRDALDAKGHLLVGGDGVQQAPSYSPNGLWLTYVTTIAGTDQFMLARADGSSSRQIATIPPTGNAQAAWRPDSGAVALIYEVSGAPRLSIVSADGSATRVIDLGELAALDISWRPPDGSRAAGAGEGSRRSRRPVHDQTGRHRPARVRAARFVRLRLDLDALWLGLVAGRLDDRLQLHRARPDHVHLALPHAAHRRRADSDGRALPGPTDPAVQEGWPAYSPDGRWILVHRWTFKSDTDPGAGWLAVMPADGSAPARDIGPRIPGGEDTGLTKTWSPDGSRILMSTHNTSQVFSIDPITGSYEQIPWAAGLPDWQRVARP